MERFSVCPDMLEAYIVQMPEKDQITDAAAVFCVPRPCAHLFHGPQSGFLGKALLRAVTRIHPSASVV